MIIEIKGVQFVNKGAELMLHAVIQQIEQHWPTADIALRACPNSPYLKRASVKAWQKMSLRKHVLDLNWLTYLLPLKLTAQLKRYGILTEADIDLVLDASGFAYGDQWSARQLVHISREVARFQKKGKPYIFLPQALGPFNTPARSAQIAKFWADAALIFARDKVSYDYVAQCLPQHNNLFLAPDFTNLVSGTLQPLQHAARTLLVIPNGKMLSPRNNRSAWRETYVAMMADYCREANARGFIPLLLNHDGVKDEALCTAITLASGIEITTISIEDPLAVKGLIGQVAAVISSRFHGCVSALSQGIPCIGTSWSHKYEQLFGDYHQEAMLISEPGMVDVSAQLTRLLSAEYLTECRQNPCIAQQKILSQEMWSQVVAKVAEYYD